MRASRVPLYVSALAFLVGAVLAYQFRRRGADAQLVAAALALVCVGGAVSALLRRRLVAGLCALVVGIGLWAATGGVEWWLREHGRRAVGASIIVALFGLVLARDEEERQ
jgi:hypothetical protein